MFSAARLRAGIFIFVTSQFLPLFVSADILFVKDGSRISGKIKEMTTQSIKIETSFAGEIAVPLESLAGVTSDEVQMVALRGGDRINARPHFDPDTGVQHLKQTNFGDLTIDPDQLLGVRDDGDPSPETLALETEIKEYKTNKKNPRHLSKLTYYHLRDRLIAL